mgnify:FL=1
MINQTTWKVETIDKGSLITIFSTAVEFEHYSVCLCNDITHRIIQTEINDGMIKSA